MPTRFTLRSYDWESRVRHGIQYSSDKMVEKDACRDEGGCHGHRDRRHGLGAAAAREWDEIRVLFWSAAIKEDAITGRLRSALLRGPRGEGESCVAGGPWDWGWGFGLVQSTQGRTTRHIPGRSRVSLLVSYTCKGVGQTLPNYQFKFG